MKITFDENVDKKKGKKWLMTEALKMEFVSDFINVHNHFHYSLQMEALKDSKDEEIFGF